MTVFVNKNRPATTVAGPVTDGGAADSAPPCTTGDSPFLTPTAFQQAMIMAARSGGAPWANLEQIVLHLPDIMADDAQITGAFQTIAQRYTALRLVAEVTGDGTAIWRIMPDFAPETTICSHPQSEAERSDLLGADRARGIDLARGGWRVSYATGGPGLWLLFTAHHALLDLPAMAVLMEELVWLLQGRDLPPRQDAGLRAFHAALAQSDISAAQAFFAERFADFESGNLLSIPVAATGRMSVLRLELNAARTHLLHQQANRCGAGLFAALQAAWSLVLARWTGRGDATFGLTLAGRSLFPDHSRTVGALIATLPQRLHPAQASNLRDLIAEARSETQALRPHHGTTLRDIRKWADLGAGARIFDSVLVYSPANLPTLLQQADPAWTTREASLLEEGDMPLTLAIYGRDRLEILFEYDSAALPEAQLNRIAGHFLRLLDSIGAADPETPLSQLDMLDPAERAGLMLLGEPAQILPDAPPCIATRFEAAVEAAPTAIALQSEATGTALDYQTLYLRANNLGHRLQEQGARPGSVVALNLPRGPDFVVALLAVLKTGAAFLPLDPALPEVERCLRATEAGAIAVIGRDGIAGLGVPLLVPNTATSEAPPRRAAPQADRLAYIIHTSGSTGRPKGVMGTTGALSAHASAAIAAFGLTPTDKVLHFAAPGFDVALEEIVPTLLAGATLILRDDAETASVQAFLDVVARQGVTVLNLPASFWHLLVEEMDARALPLPPSVRLVITGSERISAAALARWQILAPGTAWMNGYGPTETTITCTLHAPDLAGAPLADLTEVPIGRPMAHARAHILAFDGSLAPMGADGNLFIGGPAVTAGYLNHPDITARSFIVDPFRAPPARLYNTGDRASWDAEGHLRFLGRRDRQVKLRGHRIDLGDVERALMQFPGLRDARVGIDAPDTDAARLVAWVCGPDLSPDSPALAALVEHVARYMSGATLPIILPVEAFPLRPNGKVDTARLPRPAAPGGPGTDEDGPMDSLTFALLSCMARVLDAPHLRADDDIRDHGANSLMALRLASVIEARFGRTVVTTDLYRHPTPRSLARFLEADGDEPRFVVPIQPEGAQIPLFAIHVLGEKEALFRPLSARLGPDYPVYGLTSGPPKNLDEISVERMARRYFDDIQRAFPEGPVALIAVSMAAYFAFELGQLLQRAGREVRFLAVLDAMGPGGRPSRHGLDKIAAHLGEIRRHGIGHISRVLRYKRENRQIERDLASAPPGEVTGANLVLANVRAVDLYQAQPYGAPIIVYRAAESFWDSAEARRTMLGWSQVATGEVKLIDIPGDHLSILEDRNVAQLAADLATRLKHDT
ncbi:non-ribosomal peptide synthetase [Gemmobacter serpentinus]|uniref:non-ribosomal peptide synthetase n=1 Tax=Gemmobacter serpentinus TaxID=2652247 RepID=UPI00124F7535|nr:non-ribosomal peptide synthetase [Gemmobacter serpentinus]